MLIENKLLSILKNFALGSLLGLFGMIVTYLSATPNLDTNSDTNSSKLVDTHTIAHIYGSGFFYSFALLCFIAPITEEFVFRYLPYRLWMKLFPEDKREKIIFWMLGACQTVFFVFGHFYDGMKVVPYMQFLLGVLSWYKIEKQGFTASLAIHFGVNATLLFSSIGLIKYLSE